LARLYAARFAAPGFEVYRRPLESLSGAVASETVGSAFASGVFEHLRRLGRIGATSVLPMLECPVLRNFPRFADQLQFTQHNIRLDDGTFTKPESARSMVDYPYFKSARGILETVFPGDKSRFRLADVGCLEGGYAVEFARMGFQVVGIEVRDLNIAACDYAKSKTDLPNLQFVQDNALNIASHGLFDAVFCCGLFYHLDDPKQYLETLSSVTKKLLILVTHFSLINPRDAKRGLPTAVRSAWSRLQLGLDALRKPDVNFNLLLSPPSEHEGLPGRWYTEFQNDRSFSKRETAKWASWDNRRSFWIQREHLLQAIRDVGFDLVMEQYDNLEPSIVESLLGGSYQRTLRGTFIGIKTGD